MTGSRRAVVAMMAAGWASSAWAAKEDTVLRLVSDGKAESAREKCARWEVATDPEAGDDLKEACAKADWGPAEATDGAEAWAAYRAKWTGTSWSATARVREAAAVLREVDPAASEDVLLALADQYRGTPAAEDLRKLAQNAAYDAIESPEDALAVVERYPEHPRVAEVVQAHTAAFVTVEVAGRDVRVTVDSRAKLPEELSPRSRWVSRAPDGTMTAWDEAATGIIGDWGVSSSWVAGRQPDAAGLRLPLCHVPDQPAGWTPGVEVTVGTGSVFRAVGFDEGCGPDGWPVLVGLGADGRALGVSLRPGHVVDLESITTPQGRGNTRVYLPDPSGSPALWGGAIYQKAGKAWLVTPLSGGEPWASGAGPGAGPVVLDKSLRGGQLPAGWTTSSRDGELKVSGALLDRMPPALQDWRLPGVEGRTVPPLVGSVVGLVATSARPPQSAAPVIGPNAGWSRLPDGEMERKPPTGGKVAGLYQMSPAEQARALEVVVGVGIDAGRVELIDGWRSDLDGDRVAETFLRAKLDGRGALLVVDPLAGKEAKSASQARVFVLDSPRVLMDGRPAGTPFTFRKGDFTYLAWSGGLVTGPSSRVFFLEVVRFDGVGYAGEGWDLP